MLTKAPLARRILLLLSSYVFYMSWSSYYIGLIVFSTLVDYLIGRQLGKSNDIRVRKLLLVTSLVTNLGLLFVFKYFNFFIETSEELVSVFGLDVSFTRSRLLLPVGISFYTFQTLSYTIDVYRRKLQPESSLLEFAIFVSFFPQLVAGPIVRAMDFLPQLKARPACSALHFQAGLLRIAQGLVKKVVIADLLATLLVDDVFSDPKSFGTIDQILALYGYAFQIYNDFSAYTDIAIGSAMLLGLRLPENFDQPYLATDVRDFWGRWHISLSTWLRDYLYIPLGGNRHGERRTTFNLMLTMLLGGLWHGAAMNFLLWGLYHGILLVLAHRYLGEKRSTFISVFSCFHLVVFGWLLFRVESIRGIQDFFQQVFTGYAMPMQASGLFITVLALAAIEHLISPKMYASLRENLADRLPSPVLGCLYATVILVLVGASVDAPAFLYFQF